MSETVAPTTETTQATPASTPAAAPAADTLLSNAPPANETPEQAAQRQRDEAGRFAKAVPDKYEFKAPEIDGKPLEVDPEALGGFEAAARDAGLTQEQFAKIAPLGAQLIAQKVSAAMAAAMPEHLRPDTQAKWQDAIRGDAEIGGAKLQANLGQAAKVIDQFGGAELKAALDLTRAGNHPAIVKAFVAIGKAMGDGEGLITGRPAGSARPVSAEQAARNFYNANGGNYPPLEG